MSCSTSKIGELFDSISKMLKEETDVLMLLFEESHPDFYRVCKNARVIVDYTRCGKTNGDDNKLPPAMPTYCKSTSPLAEKESFRRVLSATLF